MIFGNKTELSNMNLRTDMCRVCMMTSEYLKDIVSFELTPEIISMLSSFANIDVSTDECLPSLICNKCYTSLMESVNFKNLCVQSNNAYKDYILKIQNECIDMSQGNKEIPPPKTIKIESKRKDSESEISHNVDFITVKNLSEMIKEPAPELLNALGLKKVSDGDNKTKEESPNRIKNKDCKLNNNKKPYKCKVCRDVIYDYGVYRRHLASHGELPYSCKICGEHFSKARALKEHFSNIHSGEKPYACTQCSSKFVRLSDLTTHLRKHSGTAQTKRFSKHTVLESSKYKKSATGFGDHVCKLCERKFRKKCDLERHERVHSGEKPYTCPECGGKFQQAHNLTKHMVTHTGVRSYTCDICQKTFGRSDVLTRHMHVHEVSKPFSCEFCYRTFVRQSQLTNHMVKRHPKSDSKVDISQEKNFNGAKIKNIENNFNKCISNVPKIEKVSPKQNKFKRDSQSKTNSKVNGAKVRNMFPIKHDSNDMSKNNSGDSDVEVISSSENVECMSDEPIQLKIELV